MMSAFLCAGRNICLASISVMCFGDQMLPKVAITMEWYDERGLLQVISIVVSCNMLLLMSYMNSLMQFFKCWKVMMHRDCFFPLSFEFGFVTQLHYADTRMAGLPNRNSEKS